MDGGVRSASKERASGLDLFRSVDFLYKMLTPMTDRSGRFTMVITVPNHGTYQAMVTAMLGGSPESNNGASTIPRGGQESGLPEPSSGTEELWQPMDADRDFLVIR